LAQKIDYENLTKCPYCGSSLTGTDAEKAKHAFEEAINAENQIKIKKQEEVYEGKLEDQKQLSDVRAREQRENYVNLIEGMKKDKDEINKLKENELQKKILVLKEEKNAIGDDAFAQGKDQMTESMNQMKDQLQAKNLDFQRAEKTIEDLQRQMAQRSSETQGTIGEHDLYNILKNTFEDDHFELQKRGNEEGDILQTIKTSTGFLKIPIIYDNKQAQTISVKDTEKAKRYMKKFNTEHVIIVSRNLPKKEIPDGTLGKKDGVICIHPNTVAIYAEQIRNGLIKISQVAKSQEDEKTKQVKLYRYVASEKFILLIKSFKKVHDKMTNSLASEMKNHQTTWNKRKGLHDELLEAQIELSSSIESITQGE